MSVWRRLAREAHQRSVGQVVGIYVLGGWAAYKVVLDLYEGLGLPRWVPAAMLLLLLLGLPIVATTAFVQRGLPKRRKPDSVPGTDPAVHPGLAAMRGMSTWPRLERILTWRRSLAMGVGAFALLGLVTTGFSIMRAYGIGPVGTLIGKGVVDANDRVVLADFQATGVSDSSLARAVTEAIRMDLMQSRLIRLAEPPLLRVALQRMQRDPADGLPEDAARELATREGLKAVLAGELARLGPASVLSLRVVNASDGAVLASFRAIARDSTELIDAVDRLSKDLRTKFGESLKNIRASAPLARVSTSSLPALRKYSAAFDVEFKTGNLARVIGLLEEAVALDSTFAMAWHKLGRTLNNVGLRNSDELEASRRAYQLRDRLPELERYVTVAGYASTMGEPDQAIAAYRNALELDSLDAELLTSLALQLLEKRDYGEAENLLRRSIAQSPTPFRWSYLVTTLYFQGKKEEARHTQAEALEKLPENAWTLRREIYFAASDERYEAIDSIARFNAARFANNTAARGFALSDRQLTALLLGKLSLYTQLGRELEAFAAANGLNGEQLRFALARARVSAVMYKDPIRALREADQALATVPLDSLSAAGRPYFSLAEVYLEAEEPARAAAIVEEAEAAVVPAERTRAWRADLEFMRAYIDLRSGRAAAALASLKKLSETGWCTICYLPQLGMAYEATRQPDSARAVYERYLTSPFLSRVVGTDPGWRAFVLERAGDLHLAAGDTTRAVRRYAEFVRLWANADSELQPRVRAVRTRLATLRGPG